MLKQYCILKKCEILMHDSHNGTVRELNVGDTIECEILGHPKRMIGETLGEDTMFFQVRFEDGRFAIFNHDVLKEIGRVAE